MIEYVDSSEGPDAWLCICGNAPHRDGFYPCILADGVAIEVEPLKDGPWKSLFYCDRCTRVIDQATDDELRVTVVRGRGPVMRMDDERTECAECGHLHWVQAAKAYDECPLRSEGCTCKGQ